MRDQQQRARDSARASPRARAPRRGRDGSSARRAAAGPIATSAPARGSSRIRQPPEKLATAIAVTRVGDAETRRAATPRARVPRSRRSPRSDGEARRARARRSRARRSAARERALDLRAARASPSCTNSIAGVSTAGVSCATCAIVHFAGMSTSPASWCSSPVSSANRLDLPEPFGPTSADLLPRMNGQRRVLDQAVRAAGEREVRQSDQGLRRLMSCAVSLAGRRPRRTLHPVHAVGEVAAFAPIRLLT